MNVHQFIKAIRENKDLYNEDEYVKLLNIAEKEYHKYLKKKFLK
jgi:hypothetical protein